MVRIWTLGILLAASAPVLAAEAPVLTGDGLGALHVGMSRHQAEQAIGHHIKLDSRSSDDLAACALGTVDGMPDVNLLLEGYRIHVISVAGHVATADGVHVATTEAELKHIFGKRAVFQRRPYFDRDQNAHSVIVRLHGKREFLFQTEHGAVTNILIGDRPAVEYWEGCS